MSSKVLLLDMDGVVTKNKVLSKAIKNRVTGYVKKTINKHMTNKKADEINKVLYTEFGHTLLGLQQVYNSNITLEHFTNYVYDDAFVKHIKFKCDEEIALKKLLETCKEVNIPVYIFSNAPERWCKTILESMNINNMNIIGSDHYIFKYNTYPFPCLKPNYITYIKVMQFVNQYKNRELLFVDDSIKNLMPVLNHPNWKTIWMTEDSNIYSKYLYSINDIEQLYAFF
jgi:FMN phosphatase YigB (HAD superfamily)